MKKHTLISLLLLSFILAACSANLSTETAPTAENNNLPSRPTPTTENPNTDSTEQNVPYPGLSPTAVSLPEGYPAGEKTVWVLYPVGIQCEDAANSTYANEQAARAGLTAAGVTVHDVTTTELMVCSACNCPTSAHYRAQIDTSQLNTVLALGWTAE